MAILLPRVPRRKPSSQHGRVERPRQAEGPGERPTSLCELETSRIGVQMRAPARQPPAGIGDDDALDRHEAQQLGLGRANAAAHTRTQWSRPIA
ncbi:hypothetical protein Arub01_09710 [Actinomadura rubrobrunea]|uniref:Uncharacterized protein n=1 Tax=Actinomadura rubrobrunea TaxID=115335 RepID=A0A9W6PTU5_9ACTN|nr:hypothetical protein Arub01_09710 [Actinomadura rubrobrunea]